MSWASGFRKSAAPSASFKQAREPCQSESSRRWSKNDRTRSKTTGLWPGDSRGRLSARDRLFDFDITGAGLDFYGYAAAANFAADFFLPDRALHGYRMA